ncbi:MAG: hypothetical protein DWQ01_13745 [Planctomycetota bacterium]|nr:MAG: hypothetical protein DWQ01_13745 [Planctomycetota bacterium]
MTSPSSFPGNALSAWSGNGPRSAYLAGVGGTGMRGLATFLLQNEWQVFGADRQALAAEDRLFEWGLQWCASPEEIPVCSLAIRSAAVPAQDPGFAQACCQGARPLRYAEALGEISRQRPVLAVAGTHGKTTCSAWIAFGLRQAGIRAGYLVGGHVPQLGGSADWGENAQPLVMESCEYDRSFHQLRPRDVALTNVEAEHPDTYPGGYEEVLQAFRRFLQGGDRKGTFWIGPEAPDLSADFPGRSQAVSGLKEGCQIGLPGRHNRQNAALVAAVLSGLGCTEAQIDFALQEFTGASRRMEALGRFQQAEVYSDYAHHPSEVKATLQALKERHPEARLWAVFQPHQARRFQAYRQQFAPSLDQAQGLLLLEIYRARDPEALRPSVVELLAPLQARRPDRPVQAVADWLAGRRFLEQNVKPGDLVVCLGAGDVDAFARDLAR